MRTTFLVLLMPLLATAALAQTKTINDTQCEITVPSNWAESKVGGVGAHAADRSLTAQLHSFQASDYPSAVDSLKQMSATVLEDNSSRMVLEMPMGGTSRKQVFVLTKTKPVGCRASVMYSQPALAATAKQIAESVKPLK
jgi:hypothetical protein